MRKTRGLLSVVLSTLLAVPTVRAQQHLVGTPEIDERLAAAAAARTADRSSVDGFLASREAARAGRLIGADLHRLRAGLHTLSDRELHDLAVRAEALRVDPEAGLST